MSEGITVAVTDHAVERVDRRFTDSLAEDDAALVDPARRWRERRDRE
jgi:hypothetical protein